MGDKMEKFGEKLRKLREYNGFSQSELAFELGVSKGTVQHWEHNRRQPSASNAYRLSKAFGVPIEYLCKRGEFTPRALNKKYQLILTVK